MDEGKKRGSGGWVKDAMSDGPAQVEGETRIKEMVDGVVGEETRKKDGGGKEVGMRFVTERSLL